MCGLQREKGKKKRDLRGQPWVCRPPASNCSVARGVEKGLAPAVGLPGVPAAHRAMAACPPRCVSIKVPIALRMVHRGLRYVCWKEKPHGRTGSGDGIQKRCGVSFP